MNLEQIIRKARFEVDAIRADGSTSQLWSTEECRDAVNDAMDRAARIMRLADSDILTKTMRSTDSSFDSHYEEYDPTVLQITAEQTDYELPPDLVSIVNILPITESFDGIHFYPAKSSGRLYSDQRTVPTSSLHTVEEDIQTYLYTQIGQRTLRLAPTPKDTFDIELVYRYRPPRLLSYTTEIIDLTNGSTAVLGVGTTWVTSGLRTPAEVIYDASSIDVNSQYARVSSFTSDTALVLKRNWTGSTDHNLTGYAISMVPLLPLEHHQWLAKMTAAIMLRKINIELSDKSVGSLEAQLSHEIMPEVTIRQVQESIPVEPFNPGG
jgi:hypothetical protein